MKTRNSCAQDQSREGDFGIDMDNYGTRVTTALRVPKFTEGTVVFPGSTY